MKLLFATQNTHKVKELRELIGVDFELTGPEEAGITEEIPETGDTLEANAFQKARYAFDKTGLPCFADDSGLEVEALGGEPGVYSARYAGPQRNNLDNIAKLLHELAGKENRRAQFRTVIAFTDGKKELLFEGIVKGHIIAEMRGKSGFGYDPLFVPEGHDRTFAEMDAAEKNALSHRGKAVEKLLEFLGIRR